MTTKRERKAEVRKLVLEGGNGRSVYQVRPNTIVLVYSLVNDAKYSALGFSRVTWRDTWDPEIGVEIATNKAVAKIVRAIMADKPLTEGGAFTFLSHALPGAPEPPQPAPADGPTCGATDCAQGFGMPCEACG